MYSDTAESFQSDVSSEIIQPVFPDSRIFTYIV